MLEVGVDRGVTLLPLALALAVEKEQFVYVGIDILLQESLKLTLKYFPESISQRVFLIEENSLTALPKFVDQGTMFDAVLIDGDHNYHTVSQELQHVAKLVKPGGIILIDDYNGKWSDRDLWYSEREGYEGVKAASMKVDTDKHGVKPAVDEWLAVSPEWVTVDVGIAGEPVLLTRHGDHLVKP